MVAVSKIDKFQLGPEVRKLNMQYPGKYPKIAEEINKKYREEGVYLNRQNVATWIKNAQLPTSNDDAIKELSQELMAEDRKAIVSEYTKLLEAQITEINKILESEEAKSSQKINAINAIIGPKGGMNRAMNAVGFGNQAPAVQNNIIVGMKQDIAKEFIQVIMEEFNGQSDEIISVIQRRFLADGR